MIIWYVTLLLLCLLVMICAPSRPFGFIEVMGVFLDQGMARTKTRILLPLLMASFSFSMMYKSIMISHLIKPAVLKGPENIKDLIENFPDMIISYYDAGYAPYEPMYAKHPERFNLSMGIETPYPHEVQAFLNGKLAVLEHTPEFFEWTFRPEKVGCRSELGKPSHLSKFHPMELWNAICGTFGTNLTSQVSYSTVEGLFTVEYLHLPKRATLIPLQVL